MIIIRTINTDYIYDVEDNDFDITEIKNLYLDPTKLYELFTQIGNQFNANQQVGIAFMRMDNSILAFDGRITINGKNIVALGIGKKGSNFEKSFEQFKKQFSAQQAGIILS